MTTPFESTRERYGITLAWTYRYLRIGISAAVLALLSAVTIESTRIGVLHSISAYYYTDARNIFVAALLVISFGLLALSEPGVERTLRTVAALFGPIIALCPTSIPEHAVPGIALVCPVPSASVCVPEPYRSEVAVGIGTYLIIAVVAWAVVLVLKASVPGRLRPAVPSLAITGAVILLVAVTDLGWHEAFIDNAHGLAALAFFATAAALAVVSATRRYNERYGYVLPRGFRAAYLVIAVGMVGAVLAVLTIVIVQAVLGIHLAILIPELVELVLFFAFWVLQSIHKERVIWAERPRTPGDALDGSAV